MVKSSSACVAYSGNIKSLQTSDCFCLCSPFVHIVDSLFSISSLWLSSIHLSLPLSSAIYPKGLLLRVCPFTTDKNWKGILHIKAEPSTPLQFHLIKRWLLQLQWVALETYHLRDEREGHICMRWKSTLNFLMAKMNVYSITATKWRRRLWVCTGQPLNSWAERWWWWWWWLCLCVHTCVCACVYVKGMPKVTSCKSHIWWSPVQRIQNRIKESQCCRKLNGHCVF